MSNDETGSIMIVSPEDGDGETWYYEVTRYGETWDGRAETKPDAEEEARELLDRLIRMQEETGRNHAGPLPGR